MILDPDISFHSISWRGGVTVSGFYRATWILLVAGTCTLAPQEAAVCAANGRAAAPAPISQVAELLGITLQRFRSMLANEGGRRRDDKLSWAEAAAYRHTR
jgi:hypothetical protein